VFLSPEPVYGKLLELSPKSSLGGLARAVHACQAHASPETIREALLQNQQYGSDMVVVCDMYGWLDMAVILLHMVVVWYVWFQYRYLSF